MPIIIANIIQGRPEKTRENLIESITEATVKALHVKPESVRVLINEIPSQNFGIAGASHKTKNMNFKHDDSDIS